MMIMNDNPNAIEWLLEKENPSVRYRTLRELLDRPEIDSDVMEAKELILSGKDVTRILNLMHPDGYWLVKNRSKGGYIGDSVEYSDYNTTHFCLAYLAELGLTKEHPQIRKAADRYLNLQNDDGDFFGHFSCLYGLNIRTFVRLGYSDDARLQKTINLMLNTERYDGGYLCDMHEGTYKTKPVKSCIRGSVKALLAYTELPEYRLHQRCRNLVDYFLKRDCLFQMSNLEQPVNPGIVTTRFPITWRASLTEIVYSLAQLGYGHNQHLARAWQLLEQKKDNHGRYLLDWTPSSVQTIFKVGKRSEPNKWITLYALLAYKALNSSL